MATLVEVKIVKNTDGGPPASEWSNSYHIEMSAEMQGGDGGGIGIESDAFENAVQSLLNMEVFLHITNIRILRAVCTTPETNDDNLPQHLRVIPCGRLGQHAPNPGDVPLPLETVLKVSFAGKTGRAGFNAYRGCLYSGEVLVEQSGYAMKANVQNNLRDQLLANLNINNTREMLRIVAIRAGIVTSRFVADIQFVGVSTRQRTQKKRRQTDAEIREPKARVQRGFDDLFKSQADLAYRLARTPDDPVVIAEVKEYNRLVAILPTFGVLP